jgi:cobalt-zinc-cadmium efflux system outer membrane protein
MSITTRPAAYPKKYQQTRAARQRTSSFLTPLLFASVLLMVPPDSYAQAAADIESSRVAASVAILTLDQAVAIALQNNPDVAGLQAQADAMWAIPSQAGALPDPTLSLNAMNLPTDTFSFDQEPMTQTQLVLSQSFPFPGKRKLRRETTEHEAQAAEDVLSERRTALTGQVRNAWWQLMNLDRSLEIVDQNQLLMRDFVEIAQIKYKVGNGLQQDVLLAQLELSRLLDRELRLQGMRRSAQAELNAMLDRPANWQISLPQAPPNTNLPNLPAETQLLQQAGSDRALIDVQRDLVEAARKRLDLARKDYYPDFKLGVGYGDRQGFDAFRGTDRSDFLSVMLTINLPIYSGSKQSKAVEQRTHEISQRKYALNNTLRTVQSAISRGLADYLAARDQVVLLETAIIPQAQQTVASMLVGYQVNQVDFLNLVNTQITLYNAQINYWESLSRAKQALAKVASAVGAEALYE